MLPGNLPGTAALQHDRVDHVARQAHRDTLPSKVSTMSHDIRSHYVVNSDTVGRAITASGSAMASP